MYESVSRQIRRASAYHSFGWSLCVAMAYTVIRNDECPGAQVGYTAVASLTELCRVSSATAGLRTLMCKSTPACLSKQDYVVPP